MFFWDFRNKVINEAEHRVIQLLPERNRCVCSNRRADEIELFFKNTVGLFVSKSIYDHINELLSTNFTVFYHIEETTPDESATNNIFNIVDIFCEKLKRMLIDDVLDEGVILEIK